MHRVEKIWHKKEKPSYGHLFIEAAMIVFSILLALGIESWREHRKHEELATMALANIRTEIAANRDSLRKVLPEHRATEKYLADLLDRLARGEHIRPSTTYRPANLLTAAWETAGSTQALAYMDFKKVELLSRLYSGNRWVHRMEESWLALSANPAFQSDENRTRYVEALHQTMRDLVAIEEELAAGCDQVLLKVDAPGGAGD